MIAGPEADIRARAEKLQRLHVRLLFCAATRAAWRAAPGRVLAGLGLPDDARRLVPDPDSAQFQTEAHGRRMGVETAILRWFAGTFELLSQSGGPGFDEFLCSDHFFDPAWGLPHTSGIGQGYESVSTFFFWLRETIALHSPEAPPELREAAYTEFAIYLMSQYQRPHDPYYDRFRNGFQWRKVPGTEIPVMVVSDKFVLFTLNSPETIAQLPGSGLIDLDELAPH